MSECKVEACFRPGWRKEVWRGQAESAEAAHAQAKLACEGKGYQAFIAYNLNDKRDSYSNFDEEFPVS